jgi:hypothetical protein
VMGRTLELRIRGGATMVATAGQLGEYESVVQTEGHTLVFRTDGLICRYLRASL